MILQTPSFGGCKYGGNFRFILKLCYIVVEGEKESKEKAEKWSRQKALLCAFNTKRQPYEILKPDDFDKSFVTGVTQEEE